MHNRGVVLSLVAAIATAFAIGLAGQGAAPERQLVTRAADALGGRDRVMMLKTLRIVGWGELAYFNGGGNITGDPDFAIYRDSQRKMTEVAGAAGATVLMSNHTEFDRAYDRARIAQLARVAGEKHPYETDTATVRRYFQMAGNCAEAQRLLTQ